MNFMLSVKNAKEIELMRSASLVVRTVFSEVSSYFKEGVSLKRIDELAEQVIRDNGAVPSFKGYSGYPNATCLSVNDVVIHGIPDDYELRAGDIVSIDVGAYKNGFHGDAARSYVVGENALAERLKSVVEASFFAGIEKFVPLGHLSDISAAVQKVVEDAGFGVVRTFTGHGIGRKLHEAPSVPNYGAAGRGLKLRNGIALAIEPMITAGDYNVAIDDDGWTVRTVDGSLTAHYENTVVLTPSGVEILTL